MDHLRKAGIARVRYLLGRIKIDEVPQETRGNLDEYGIGKDRSLDDFYKFIGVDFEKKTVDRYCSKMYDEEKKEWVPM